MRDYRIGCECLKNLVRMVARHSCFAGFYNFIPYYHRFKPALRVIINHMPY